ncbi:MAG: SH3 domain-containing protein [Bacilli bacterium]|nr:SH3 domain-containing protein [Bacilli bacterium]
MKKISYFIFFVTMLLVFSIYVSAGEVVIITGNDVRFRPEPNTNNEPITSFDSGTELTLLDKNVESGNGCKKEWYKVSYGSIEGYVCSEFAKIEVINELNPEEYQEYSEYLSELGFPETYIPKLVELHVKHPNWQFRVMNVDYDFDKLVNKEYDGYYKGWSLIEDTGRYYDGYKSVDSWSYNYLTNEFSTKFNGGGDVWYAANKETIAYYIDPRNFLNNERIFMFETLSYNNLYHTKEGIDLMLKGTFMETGYADTENEKTFADAFLDAAVQYKVSPYVLISRVIQEVGAKGSTIVSGTVSGYEGYYNFYNIKAAGNTKEETIANGLEHAKEKGWDTKYKAIIGGASFLAEDYIDDGQDTLYLQKWDVVGSTFVTHQYMQNIKAPYSESIKTYRGYNDIGLIDNAFVFAIPVYKNMPSETKLPNSGNPNNYLLNLSVNGIYLFSEATIETEFSMNLAKDTTSIEIDASKVYSKAVISGAGSVSISADKQTIPITVTAENGDVRIYNINITRTDEIPLSIGEVLRVLGIVNDGTYMSGFTVGTDISLIRQNIINKEPKAEVTTFDKSGNSKSSGIIANGDVINIKTRNEEKKYQIILYGDVNSDGKIDKVDAAGILRYYYKYTDYDEITKMAADINKNNDINKEDVAAVLRDLYGYSQIKQ